MKKKILSIFLISILVIGLTGCGSNESEKTNGKGNGSKELLSSNVKIGDYVDYKLEKGISYTATQDKTGYDKDQTLETTGEEKWRVMKINSDGTVDLIMDGYAKTIIDKHLYFKGKLGVTNFENELSNVANIFLNKDYATKARSLSKTDFEDMLDIEATKNQLLKQYDIDSSLYKRDENIDISGSRNSALENMSKSYYSYINGYTYGNTINVDGETIKFNLGFSVDRELNKCITNETYTDLLNGSWAVWLSGKPLNFIGYESNRQSYFVDYVLNKFTFDSKLNTYNLKNANIYEVYLKETSKNTFTKINSEFEYAIDGGVKPIVTLKANIKVNGGTGTEDDPYQLSVE